MHPMQILPGLPSVEVDIHLPGKPEPIVANVRLVLLSEPNDLRLRAQLRNRADYGARDIELSSRAHF